MKKYIAGFLFGAILVTGIPAAANTVGGEVLWRLVAALEKQNRTQIRLCEAQYLTSGYTYFNRGYPSQQAWHLAHRCWE